MKKLLILLFSIVVAGELEVDGDLKVTGTVDANGNPITNVGAPQTMSDAVNAGILAAALSDDGVYEYKMYLTKLLGSWGSNDALIYFYEYIEGSSSSNADYSDDFHTELLSLLSEGWIISTQIKLGEYNNYYKNIWILKRPVSDD